MIFKKPSPSTRAYSKRFASAFMFSLVGLSAGLVSSQVFAASSPWVAGHKSEVRLLADSATVGDRDTLSLGLEFVMDPKWKIYWRSPGEAGQAPVPDWTQSTNLKSAEIQWPMPERFTFFGVQTFGYENRVVLPIEAKLDSKGAPTSLDVSVDYLICDDLCVPTVVDLSLQLPGGDLALDSDNNTIQGYLDAVPTIGNNADLRIEDFRIDTTADDKPLVRISATSAQGFSEPDILIEAPEAYAFGIPEIQFSEDRKVASLSVASDLLFDAEETISASNVTLTLIDGDKGIELPASSVGGVQTRPDAGGASELTWGLLFSMLGFAVIGGLILNLMPCVLPVLSIKLMSVIGKSDKSRREVRLGFLATSLGIIVSFLVIAAGLIALKSAGSAIGWGIQFQQPLFILGLTAIILLFAANMFGWFEISLPSSLAGLGGGQKGLMSDFSTGAFATLLATPCSAPFLGTAVSFALLQSTSTILLIFLALGVGMALPYLIVIAFPGFVRFMPRPGAWMMRLRQVLGVLLAGTAIWLLSILFGQLGWTSTLIAAAISIGLLALIWFLRSNKGAMTAGAAITALALLFVPPLFGDKVDALSTELKGPWVHFEPEKIADHVADGKLVYVDVTADWCVTCKVNKAVVFASDEVNEAFESDQLVAMVADWTRPSDDIAAYLRTFERAGIPFNAVYSQKQPEGVPLPELLTPGLVLDALATAR